MKNDALHAIPSGDVTLIADSYGDPGNPPVLLLHGGGQTRHSWNSMAHQLGDNGWLALTVDLRGHGDSGWSPTARYGMDAFSGDVTAIAEYLGRPPVLVGASLGGAASLAALGYQRELALGLVLVDVSPFVRPEGTNRIRAFMTARPHGYETLDDVADHVAAYLPHRPRPRNIDGLRRNLRQVDGRWHWHWDPAFLRSSFDQPVHRDPLIDPERLSAASTSLRIPTMLIRGGESDVLDPIDARKFLELVPHAEYVNIDGAHHMVAGDDNSIFQTVVHEFLERRVRARLDVFDAN